MNKYVVEIIDPGCGCCSYVPVAEFDTLEEAEAFVANKSNYTIWEDEDYDD